MPGKLVDQFPDTWLWMIQLADKLHLSEIGHCACNILPGPLDTLRLGNLLPIKIGHRALACSRSVDHHRIMSCGKAKIIPPGP